MSEDYCDLCDLPRSTCVHGMPAPPPTPPPATAPKPRPKSAPLAPPRARTPRTTAPVRRAPRKWTPPEDFCEPIVSVLQEAGGALDQDEVFAALEPRLEETLLPGDRERTPEGELRWQYAARRARQALLTDGVMGRGRPGVWQLTEDGRSG